MTWWRKLTEPPTVEEVPAEPPREPAEPAVFTWLGEHCGRKGHRRYDDTAIYVDDDNWGASA